MTEYSFQELPRVSESWILRNDGKYILAYKPESERKIYKVLSEGEASIIPLFDGSNTVADIWDAFRRIYAISPHNTCDWLSYFEAILDSLISVDGLISFDGKASPSLSGGKAGLIPDFSDYHFPSKRLVRPLSIALVFTNRCPCACIYCYAERKMCTEVGLDVWLSVFEEIAANGISMVDVGGGDIFSRKDAFEILDEMVSRNFLFFLSTKSYISRYDADRLSEMGIGLRDIPVWNARPLQVSIDSADPETAAALVRSPGYLERAGETVDNLVKAGIAPRVKAVLTSLNAGAMEGIVRHFHARGVTEFNFAQYTRSSYRHDDRLFLSRDEKLRSRETSERLARDFAGIEIKFQDDISTDGGRKPSKEEWNARATCSGGRTSLQVKPDGDVTLCEQIPHAREFVVGNVFKDGISGVWNSRELGEFLYPPREKFKGTVCFDCPEFRDCFEQKGHCFRNAYYAYGTIYEARPECPRQKRPCPRMI
jgi:MoaA/NifB/PqqE/SkfB family radical SAM enzyme